jgi:predicted TIM-barrel fold metal-dependent hydrolase
MAFPSGVGIVDLMLDIPDDDKVGQYDFLKPVLRDKESLEDFEFPVEYIFKDVPTLPSGDTDAVAVVLALMDHHGIDKALIGMGDVGRDRQRPQVLRALDQHGDRFLGSLHVDPNRGMKAVRGLQRAVEEYGVVAATSFPAGYNPQVPIDDRRFYPLYSKCVELDIPMFVTAGVPGPRVPMLCQHVELLDQVMYDFPDLKVVMRHGAEPWQELAVKLMLKWPNLYYSTSAFAPRYYPKAIIDYANTRGADKVLYAGYFPMGLSLDRIMAELPTVALRDDVWPRFLRDNALKVLGLSVDANDGGDSKN